MASDILIVDDESDICELVAGLLQDEGYATRTARDSDAALNEIKALTPVPISMVGRSPSINQLRQAVEKIAPTNSRIMIIGPSGAGKELAARHLHGLSARASGPFVIINAAAITPERMEVELFGVEQSNGSQQRKVGALEEAHGGTLFIAWVADMPRDTQNKILRLLAVHTFPRVG